MWLGRAGAVGLLTLAAVMLPLASADATQLFSTASFGAGTITESFEGLAPGANIESSTAFGSAYLVPGVSSPFTFGSGVTLTMPSPNVNESMVVLIGDFTLGSATWGLLANGFIGSPADVVDGNAYLGNCCPESVPVELTFAADMLRVGLFATGLPGEILSLAAYDALGNLLETVSVAAVHEDFWGTNFLGVENAAGIRRIQLTTTSGEFCQNGPGCPIYDFLHFEPLGARVPAPATLLLLAMAFAGLAWGQRHRR
jgi:hypothetical protein